tara:strand:+ start:253 stop:738 length:486 start_codon:yes stop_codon:yes gene_type:complete
MKKGKIWIMCMLIALSSQLYSQDIADVSATDRSYNAIKNSVKKGYISLYADDTFKPDQNLTRKEIALVIDMLITYIDKNKVSLSTVDLAELKTLSDAFRRVFKNIEEDMMTLDQLYEKVEEEQKVIQYEFTDMKEDLDRMKERNKLVWVGVGVAAILGIVM